jgi:hypothetical protein
MTPLMMVDAWLLLGAAAQCVLVLKARRFRSIDWLLPLFLLIGGSAGYFCFIVICSGPAGPSGGFQIGPAADTFVVGYGMALAGAATFVAAYAPLRLNATALLSLTLTFWAAYHAGGLSHDWFYPGLAMSAGALLFAAGRWRTSVPARMALQAWSLAAAAVVAADGVPARVAAVLKDYKKEETAHTLSPLEVLVTGAQFFLCAQMAVGLILMVMDDETRAAWYPSSDAADDRPSWPAFAALAVQGAAFAWLRRSSGDVQGEGMALAVFAALAHGAMTGEDAKSAAPDIPKDQELELRLSPGESEFVAGAAAGVRGFVVRQKAVLALVLALTVALAFARWAIR